jgi:hypothetical protein
MGNISIKNEKGAELVSARIDNRYVVAAGSWAYPHNDTSKPLTQYTAVDPKAPISEAPETLLRFIKDKETEWKAKTSGAKSTPTQPNGQTTVVEGGRNNYLASKAGTMRNAGVSRDSILVELLRINERDCDPPLDEAEVTSIADSYGRYPEGTAHAVVMNQQPDAPETATATEDEPEIEESEIATRPIFPRFVMQGTSLYEGLAKPASETSAKYPEMVWLPAVQLLLNSISMQVHLKDKPSMVPNMFVGVIAPYGRFFKSSCCELGHKYFEMMGLLRKQSRDTKNSEGKIIITSVGSTEGLGKELSRINAKRALLYFDELGKFAGKAGIENSSLGEDLLTIYESGFFSNLTKESKNSFCFESNSYCFGWQWCTTDRAFPKHWAKLDNISSGLNDRMFFLLAPETPKEAEMYNETDALVGMGKTFDRIQKAIAQRVYDYEDREDAKRWFKGLDARGLAAAERLALYFAVDLGIDSVTDDCCYRARELVNYRRAVLLYLDPVEGETLQGKKQMEIVRELRRNGGKMPYRDLMHELHGERWGSGLWKSCFDGIVENGTIAFRKAKPGKGADQRPAMVYLLKQRD